nr:EOG090X05NZ [Eulimnadia texana]
MSGSVLLIGSKYAPVSKCVQPARAITSRTFRQKDAQPKPAPFPYKEKKYGLFQVLFDDTRSRFDENTKLVVIEGPPTAGKDKLAKKLAEELEMLYMPNPMLGDSYINSYGFDLRQLNDRLPEDVQFVDESLFVKHPNHRNIPRMQLYKYMLRYGQHIDAITHILNTGQGVVLSRCSHSDYVFTEAMYKQGFISQSFYNYYQKVKANVMPFMLRPHLVIYLDVPVEEIKRRIQERKNPVEINSPVYQEPFLKSLEKVYKQDYLQAINEHAELLVYDWSEGGEAEVVVEDIERIDFEKYGIYDDKMKDWRLSQTWQLSQARYEFTNYRQKLLAYFNIIGTECPEIMSDGGNILEAERLILEQPSLKYSPGFNAAAGDKGVLWKI